VPTTAQFVYWAHDLDKPEVIARILQAENRHRVMIFCRTKRSAQRLSDDLEERGFAATSIHGDLNQVARERALKRFRDEGSIDVLVATDVAARGIDVEGVTHVINYECPEDEKTYIHRIGRTGRAGASGIAVTFVDWADQTRWKVINNGLGLPFEQPEETYSTSAHLYHDMGIDPSAKGRIVPPKDDGGHSSKSSDRERRPRGDRSDRPRADRSGSDKAGSERTGTERPRSERPRNRKRLRNGQPVAETGRTDTGLAAAPVSTAPSATTDPDSETSAPRRRRRRSRGSADAAGAATSPTDSASTE